MAKEMERTLLWGGEGDGQGEAALSTAGSASIRQRPVAFVLRLCVCQQEVPYMAINLP